MTRLVLIRHGETCYNKENRYCGTSDPELNKTGISQAESLARRIRDLKIERVYSSNLKRAIQTAGILFEGSAIKQSPDFREINFGIFEGLGYKEILQRYKNHYSNWTADLVHGCIPQGETLAEVFDRVRRGLLRLLSDNKNGVAALVAHSGPIRALLCDALKLGMDSFWLIEQHNAALNIVNYSEDQKPHVEILNDISHL
ncbi:MAG: histidine phosphatase family protein [Candidatus Omnitrophota bacterium]